MANLQHIKGTRTKILNSFPVNSYGSDGDIVCVSIKSKGVYLCIKSKGRWFVANKLNDIRKLDRQKMEKLFADKLSIKNLTLTKDELDISKGDFTLDVEGDIEINADGGQVAIKDGSDSHFLFDCDTTMFQIYDDANENDFFRIRIAAEGATLIATNDADTVVAHLTLQPDGDLVLDPVSQKTIINATDSLYFDGGTHTNISENSSDNLRITVGGDVLLDLTEASTNSINAISASITLDDTFKLIFDGSLLGHTYIHESADDILDFYVGAKKMLALDEANSKITLAAAGHVAAIADGTEFSATNSAYAGMILGYTCVGADVADDSYPLTTGYVCFLDSGGTAIRVVFITPPSEFVEIEAELYYGAGSGASDLQLTLSNHATYGSNSLTNPNQFDKSVREPARGHSGTITQKWLLQANNLAAMGSANSIFIAAKAIAAKYRIS